MGSGGKNNIGLNYDIGMNINSIKKNRINSNNKIAYNSNTK